MLRRFLLAAALIAATSVSAGPGASAGPASGQCATGGVKVAAAQSPADISVMDTSTGAPVAAVVTITGSTFTITVPVGATYSFTGASWCLKASTATAPAVGSGTSGVSQALNKNGVAHDIGYLVVYSVTTPLLALDTCLDGGPGVLDLRGLGPINTFRNVEARWSYDGSCSGAVFVIETIVSAPDAASANAACLALGAGIVFQRMQPYWPTAGADWWRCFRADQPSALG